MTKANHRLWSQADYILCLVYQLCRLYFVTGLHPTCFRSRMDWVSPFTLYFLSTVHIICEASEIDSISQLIVLKVLVHFSPFTDSEFWFQCLNILGWRRPWVFLNRRLILHPLKDHNLHFHYYPHWNKSLKGLVAQPPHLVTHQRFKIEVYHLRRHHQFLVKGLKV